MAKINLLPWRAERRKQREREFFMMLGAAAAAAVLVWLLWWYWMGLRLDNQDERNAYLKTEITKLESKLSEIKELESTKSKLLARKTIIEQLQSSRAQMVHLFDELVKTIPDGARLNSLKQTADVIALQGVAQSNAAVATYMRNLDASKYLQRSDLQKTEIKGTDKRNRFEFSLTVKTRPLENPEDKAGATPGTESPAPSTPGAPKPAAPPASNAAPPTKPANAGGTP